MKLRYPMPPPSAGFPRRLAQLVLLPIAVGGTIGVAIDALIGDTAAVLVICTIGIVFCVHVLRWARRMKHELAESQAEFERVFRHVR